MTRTDHESPHRPAGRRWTATVARAAWRLVQGLDRRDPWWLRAVPGWWKRRVGRRLRRLLDPLVPAIVEIDGHRLAVPRALRGMYALDDYEALTCRLLDACLAPGMVAVDGGANIGLLTLHMARRVGDAGRVIAAEPDPRNREALARNLALNGVRNVEVAPVALGVERTRRTFFLGGTGSSLYRETAGWQSLEVEVVPLDELAPGRVDFVKLDVEGAELEALAGMERLLAANPRALLLVEWSPEMQRAAGQAADALPLRLVENGFRVRAFDDGQGRERPLDEVLAEVAAGGGADHWYVNLLATRGDFPAALDELS